MGTGAAWARFRLFHRAHACEVEPGFAPGSGEGGPLKSPDELRRENEALGDRISKLSAAILRISASLDVHTVLHEVVDSARALTGARYGVITTIDDAETAPELRQLRLHSRPSTSNWPTGPTGRGSSNTSGTFRER